MYLHLFCCSSGVSSELHSPADRPTEKEPHVAFKQKVGRAPELIWTFWRRGKHLGLTGNLTLDLPTRSILKEGRELEKQSGKLEDNINTHI